MAADRGDPVYRIRPTGLLCLALLKGILQGWPSLFLSAHIDK